MHSETQQTGGKLGLAACFRECIRLWGAIRKRPEAGGDAGIPDWQSTCSCRHGKCGPGNQDDAVRAPKWRLFQKR